MNYNEKDKRRRSDDIDKMEETDQLLIELKGETIINGILDAILVNWGQSE